MLNYFADADAAIYLNEADKFVYVGSVPACPSVTKRHTGRSLRYNDYFTFKTKSHDVYRNVEIANNLWYNLFEKCSYS
ncbi:MAG: hypothetical protein IJN56_08685 [Clostridia bacterium]|nr:hypothetical protein [Clostridia bacterium]